MKRSDWTKVYVVTAMITPFSGNDEVDWDAVARLARHLSKNGSDGILVGGSTGESATLSSSEVADMVRVVKKAVSGRAVVIAGVGGSDTNAVITDMQALAKARPDAFLVTSPAYNRPPQDGLYAHFCAVADATRLPIIVYNIPGRTAVNVASETLVGLSKVSNIIGVKQANGDLVETTDLIRHAPGFVVWSGDDALTLPFLALGASGVVSVASHFVGNEIRAMILAFRQGKVDRAARIHASLLPVFKALFMVTNPIPVKGAAHRLGLIPSDRMRLPLRALTDEEWSRMVPAFKDCGLL
ncbi:MAG: 4-hydroxy-tetrahydrodipicolinate synthase [bacterium JZ-2024 1]